MTEPTVYLDVADAAWRWVLTQVRHDEDGPWIPESVAVDDSAGDAPTITEPAKDEYWLGYHSGIAGLGHTLAEIQLARTWTPQEQTLAEQIVGATVASIPTQPHVNFFDGLASSIGLLTALHAPGADRAVQRLHDLATPTGWPLTFAVPPHILPDARINDATTGTASILLAAIWARQHAVPGSTELATLAADILLAEAEPATPGITWEFIPARYRTQPPSSMPNWSHGLAGIAAALALAGAELGRADLVEAAAGGATHLVSLADTSDGGFVVPRITPFVSVERNGDPVTYNWCHGPAGTSALFSALEHAGLEHVSGHTPEQWRRRCLHSVRTSGIPQRLHPGFWDNDGRCCGTAGVGDVFLDSWQRTGEDDDLDFAVLLADDLVQRATSDGEHSYWRFVEWRRPDQLLAPGVGWMQGAAGIAAFLFRVARILDQGRSADRAERMETWWTVPG